MSTLRSMLNTAPEKNVPVIVHVAVAVIQRFNRAGQKEILIAKRADDAHQGGLWEFPGGKVEVGEAVTDALVRELAEELGIVVSPDRIEEQALCPLIQIKHDYGDKKVLLDVCEVKHFKREPECKEGQPIQWVGTEKLVHFQFPAANKPIIKACRLPRRYGITPQYPDLDSAIKGVGDMFEQGLTLLLFRQPQLSLQVYQDWSIRVLDCYSSPAVKILLSGDPGQLRDVSADGIQVPFRIASTMSERPVRGAELFSVSCHNDTEIRQAERLNADFVTLSPVLPTLSHPDSDPIGWKTFIELTAKTDLPVFPLGGMDKSHQWQAMVSGGQGIAGIRLWQTNE